MAHSLPLRRHTTEGGDVITGVNEWIGILSADLQPAFKAITMGIAAEVQNVLAPYPPAPAAGNPWYERGFGTKYRRKDGRITGRRTSEMMERKWSIISRSAMKAVLMNKASYSGWVHDSDDQTSRHAATGWQTDQTAADIIERSGIAQRIAEEAIAKVLKAG